MTVVTAVTTVTVVTTVTTVTVVTMVTTVDGSDRSDYCDNSDNSDNGDHCVTGTVTVVQHSVLLYSHEQQVLKCFICVCSMKSLPKSVT